MSLWHVTMLNGHADLQQLTIHRDRTKCSALSQSCDFLFSLLKALGSIYFKYTKRCWSQWPRGLRHELSSLAQTLGTWDRISLEACMSVCVYSIFVLSCVHVSALRRADPPFKESYRLCERSRDLKSGQGTTKDCRTIDRWMDGWVDGWMDE
jgi:hypothetical protein